MPRHEKVLRASLAGVLGFIGVGGVVGGTQMLAHPMDALGMSTQLIARSPFTTFTGPGWLLLTLLGVAPLLLLLAMLARVRLSLEAILAFGIGVMAWIVVQWWLLDTQLWLQPVIFALGAATVLLAWLLRRRPTAT